MLVGVSNVLDGIGKLSQGEIEVSGGYIRILGLRFIWFISSFILLR